MFVEAAKCTVTMPRRKNVLFTDGRGPAGAVNENQYSFSITQMWNGGEAESTHLNGLIYHLVFTEMLFLLSLPSLQV